MSPDATPPGAASAEQRLETAFLGFLESERRCSRRTLENYRHALAEFRRRHTGFTAWAALTAEDFRKHLFEQMKRGLGRATIRLHFAALRSFYKWLTHRQGLERNPLLEVQLPKQEKKLPVVLTVAQISEMLDLPLKLEKEKRAPVWGPERDAAVLELFYSTGMRLGELAGAQCRRPRRLQRHRARARQRLQRAPPARRPPRHGSRAALPAEGRRA